MPAPSADPEWDTANTNITVAPADYKANGWGLTRKLGISAYMNWWMNLVYQWILYFKSLTTADVIADFFPEPSGYKANVGVSLIPFGGSFPTDQHLVTRGGGFGSAGEVAIHIPIPASAYGKKLTELTFAKIDVLPGGGDTNTYKIFKSYKNPGALGTGTNADALLATYAHTGPVTETTFSDKVMTCDSGVVDGTFTLYLYILGTAASTFQVSNARAKFTAP